MGLTDNRIPFWNMAIYNILKYGCSLLTEKSQKNKEIKEIPSVYIKKNYSNVGWVVNIDKGLGNLTKLFLNDY